MFGNIFDLDGDGVPTELEELLGLTSLHEWEKTQEANSNNDGDDEDNEAD